MARPDLGLVGLRVPPRTCILAVLERRRRLLGDDRTARPCGGESAIGYFPFFFAGFFAAGLGLRRGVLCVAARRPRLLAGAFFAAALAGFALGPSPPTPASPSPSSSLLPSSPPVFWTFTFGSSFSPPSARVPARAPPIRTSTTLDHSTWYVDTSEYGTTCTFGRLRPDRYNVRLVAVGEDQDFAVGDLEAREELQEAARSSVRRTGTGRSRTTTRPWRAH